MSAPLQEPPAAPPLRRSKDEWKACHEWIKYVRQDERVGPIEYAVLDAALRVTIERAFPMGTAA